MISRKILNHWLVAMLSVAATASAAPAVPYLNPWLAKSSYPVAHASTDFTPIAGPSGPTRRLRADEIQWKTVGPVNTFGPMYSGPYPNGKRVIWVGGYDRVTKLDADTLETLTTYALGGNTYFGDEEIRNHIARMDKLDDAGVIQYGSKILAEPFPSSILFYRLLSRDNELYMPYRGPDKTVSLRVYGEADANDPASKIQLRREWKMPPEISRAASIMGLNMTPDGWLVMATMDGAVVALSRDFSTYQFIKLPRNGDEAPEKARNNDLFSAFVRNNVTADDRGGVYVVTRDYMHRVQWTGAKLSLDEVDGSWTVPYPNANGLGSGTSPGLMGWGADEDHLIVIADGAMSNNMVAFWRDAIPADWKGLPGYSRRVAGITPIHFGVSGNEQVQVENAPVVFGYGAFFNNTFPVQRLPDQGGVTQQWMAESWIMNVPGHEARGGAMIRWDAKARELKTAWQSQTNFASVVCTVSGATELLYCWGARDREWTLEGIDWATGKSAFHYTLGKSQRYNPMGATITIAPNGVVDCACVGGLGLVRVRPGMHSGNSRKTIRTSD